MPSNISMSDRSPLRFAGKESTWNYKALSFRATAKPVLPPPSFSTTDTLPEISRLDTKSFMNLFGEFGHEEDSLCRLTNHTACSCTKSMKESSVGIPGSKDVTNPLGSHMDTSVMVKRPEERHSAVLRGDSTASTASSRPLESDRSAAPSRRSSRSSIDFDPKQFLSTSKTESYVPESPRSRLSASRPTVLPSFGIDSPVDTASPLSETSPLLFEKPLPLAPFDMATEIQERPTLSAGDAAQRKTLFVRPLRPMRPSNNLRASASASCTKPATKSPKNNRGLRLGSYMTDGMQRRLSRHISMLTKDESSLDDVIDKSNSGLVHTLPNSIAEQTPAERLADLLSSDAGHAIMFKILGQLHSVDDLKSVSIISRGFQQIFKAHENEIVTAVVLRENPVALEVLKASSNELCPFSIRSYDKHIREFTFLNWLIGNQCADMLDPESLASMRSSSADERKRAEKVWWRISRFCQLFNAGNADHLNNDEQCNWLRRDSSGKDNVASGRLSMSPSELGDMAQLWRCMAFLLDSFRGRTREALRFGLFSNCQLTTELTEEWYLQEWIYWLASHGPSVVVSLASGSFDDAEKKGMLKWSPPGNAEETRASFLLKAIETLLQEHDVKEATDRANRASLPPRAANRTSTASEKRHSQSAIEGPGELSDRPSLKLDDQPNLLAIVKPLRRASASVGTVRRKPLAVQTSVNTVFSPLSPDTVGQEVRLPPVPFDEQQRSFSSPDLQTVLQQNNRASMTPQSPTSNPTMFQSLSMAPNTSTKLGATLFPVSYPPSPTTSTPQTPTSPRRNSRIYKPPSRSFSTPIVIAGPHSSPAATVSATQLLSAQPDAIIDPVDKAILLLTRDMGFDLSSAKRALAKCDTGFGMDVQRAIEMLTAEQAGYGAAGPSSTSGSSSTGTARQSRTSSAQRGYCCGCGRRQLNEAPGVVQHGGVGHSHMHPPSPLQNQQSPFPSVRRKPVSTHRVTLSNPGSPSGNDINNSPPNNDANPFSPLTPRAANEQQTTPTRETSDSIISPLSATSTIRIVPPSTTNLSITAMTTDNSSTSPTARPSCTHPVIPRRHSTVKAYRILGVNEKPSNRMSRLFSLGGSSTSNEGGVRRSVVGTAVRRNLNLLRIGE